MTIVHTLLLRSRVLVGLVHGAADLFKVTLRVRVTVRVHLIRHLRIVVVLMQRSLLNLV